jgi:hypothetical protein
MDRRKRKNHVIDGSRVAQLPLASKKLESLCEARLRAVPLGQRRHDLHATQVKCPSHSSCVSNLRMVDDESGVHKLLFQKVADELIQ